MVIGELGVDARAHVESLVGQEVRTLTGNRPNRILGLEGGDVIVGTAKSPEGTAVPIQWVQDAIDVLVRDSEVTVDVETLGYRSAFVGAVLATLPGVVVLPTVPRRVELRR